jgi:hypothetical protein
MGVDRSRLSESSVEVADFREIDPKRERKGKGIPDMRERKMGKKMRENGCGRWWT